MIGGLARLGGAVRRLGSARGRMVAMGKVARGARRIATKAAGTKAGSAAMTGYSSAASKTRSVVTRAAGSPTGSAVKRLATGAATQARTGYAKAAPTMQKVGAHVQRRAKRYAAGAAAAGAAVGAGAYMSRRKRR